LSCRSCLAETHAVVAVAAAVVGHDGIQAAVAAAAVMTSQRMS